MAEENKQENKVFLVRVEETLVADVYVEAASYEEAQEKVEEKYDNEELVLDYGNYSSTDYSFPEEYESITKFREQFTGETVHLINGKNELVFAEIEPVVEEKEKDVSYEKDWDFSQFTEEQYKKFIEPQVVRVEKIIKDNEGIDPDSDDWNLIPDVEFLTPNNSMFIKYKDLYIVPKIFGDYDVKEPGDFELAFSVYIPKENLKKISNKNIFKVFTHFKPDDLDRNVLVNPTFIEKKGDELIATECVHVYIGNLAYMFEGSINPENIFFLVQNEFEKINPAKLFRPLKPYLDNTSKRFGTGLSEEEFYTLTDSGNWYIEPSNYRQVASVLANPHRASILGMLSKEKSIDEGIYVGSVSFGNDFFDMQVYEDQDEPGKYNCEIRKNSPMDGTAFNEVKHFKFDALSVNELYDKYVDRDFSGCALLPISPDNMDLERLVEFKEAVTEWLLTANEIDFDKCDEYLRVQKSGKGFFTQLKEREHALNCLEEYRKDFPAADIAKKEKLTVEDVNKLAEYYVGICALVTGVKETVAADRLMLKEMIKDGLSDQRILMVADKMKDVKLEEDCFNLTYAKHFDAVVDMALQDDCIKDFRNNLGKKSLHIASQKKR